MGSVMLYFASCSLLILLPCASGLASQKSEYFIAFPKSSFPNEVLRIFVTTHHSSTTIVLVKSVREYSAIVFVQPGFTIELNPPSSFEMFGKQDHDKGIWIRPLDPTLKISVSVMKHGQTHLLSGNYLAMPPVKYEDLSVYEYHVTSYHWDNRVAYNYSSTVVVVGCEANTSVIITPSQRVEIPPYFVRPGYPQARLNAGESYTVLLQPMETLHTESLKDLTATKISSDKPLTVLGSHECADVPVNVGFCDYLVEQFSPTVTWGRLFLFASPNSRTSGDRYKIIAMKSLTSITLKCVLEGASNPEFGHITLLLNNSGESREIGLGPNRLCSAVADKPILLVQYSSGYSLDQVGDPFMLVIPPVKQYTRDQIITSPTSYNNHLTITVPLEHYASNAILLNNTAIGGWSPVYCSYTNVCGYATHLSVPPGTHRVRHVDADGKIMVFAYGFEYHDGYGQIGGVDMDWIADVCVHGALRLTPVPSLFPSDAASTSTGTLQVCVEGVWTSLCSEGLSNLEAAVACAQLGYSRFGTVLDTPDSTWSSSQSRWPTVTGDVRCLGSEQVLTNCIRHGSGSTPPQCLSSPAIIRCYQHYNITVQISTSQSHLAHRPATLVCHASLNTTLPAEQTLHITWNGDTHQITANTTRYKISETVHTCHNNSCGADNTHFKSELTVVAVKPAYNSTYYACSAAVVSSSDGQALSDLVSSSVVFSVIESPFQLFQIRLLGVGSCGHWLLQYESPSMKVTQITATITEQILSRCPDCVPTDAQLTITDTGLRCFSDTANAVTLRAKLHSPSPSPQSSEGTGVAELVGFVQDWVSAGPLVMVSGVFLRVDRFCEVIIESLDAEECGGGVVTTTVSPTTEMTTESESISTDHIVTETSRVPTTTHTTHQTTSDPITTSTTSSVQASPPTTQNTPDRSSNRSDGSRNNFDGSTTQESHTSPPQSGHGHVTMMFVGIGAGVFVITVVVLSVLCMVVTISCLKYRKPTSTHDHVISARSPFPLPLYDDPIAENLQNKSISEDDLPVKCLKL